MTKFIITGCTGAVGRALVQKVLEKDQCWVVLHRGSKRAEELKKTPGCHVVEADIAEYENLPALFEQAGYPSSGYDVFCHLAWMGTTGASRNDMDLQTKNIQGTLDAVKAAHALGCHTFLGTGSQAEYGRVEGILKADTPCFPENGYGMAKLCACEMTRVLCSQLDMKHIWARILSVYGPYDGPQSLISTAVAKMLANEETAFTAGEQDWDYLYAGDAGNALYLAALNGIDGNIYVVGSGQVRKLSDYIKVIAEKTNYTKEIGLGKIPYGDKQVMHLQADISLLKKECGFEPAVSFEEGIERTIAYWKAK